MASLLPPLGYFDLSTPNFRIILHSTLERVSAHVCDGVAPVAISALRLASNTFHVEDLDGRGYWEDRKNLGLGTLAMNTLIAFLQASPCFRDVVLKGTVHHPDGSPQDLRAKREHFVSSFGFGVDNTLGFTTELSHLSQVGTRSNSASRAQRISWAAFTQLPGEPRNLFCGNTIWHIG